MALGSLLNTVAKAAVNVASKSSTSNKSTSSKKTTSNTDLLQAKSFDEANKAFKEKYKDSIVGIANHANNKVDMGVARDMLYSNLISGSNYAGGGAKGREEWDAMVADANILKGLAGTSSSSKRSSGGGGGGVSNASLINFELPDMPTMRSGQSMADHLGIKYDRDFINKTFTDAVNKKYANLDTEFGRTQDMYYDVTANNADLLLGALRRGDRDAVRSGAASGTAAATELSGLLGISADHAQGATELAQGRADLVAEREAEMAKVAQDALKYYDSLGVQLGQLSTSELNALMTGYASQVATLGGIYNTDVLAGIERERMTSTEAIEAARNAANLEATRASSASNEAIAALQAQANREAEAIRAAAAKASGSSTGASTTPKYDDSKAAGIFGMIQTLKDSTKPEDIAKVANWINELEKIYGITYAEATTLFGNGVDAISGAAPNVSSGIKGGGGRPFESGYGFGQQR